LSGERLAATVKGRHLTLQRGACRPAGGAFATDAVEIDDANLGGRNALRGGRSGSEQSRDQRGGLKMFH